MKLMQLNVWMGRLTPQILRLIEVEQPDILTTQEMFDADGPVVFPDNMMDCLQQIRDSGGFDHVFFSPTWAMQIAHQTAQFGNAIFSKFPIAAQESFFTNGAFVADMTPATRTANSRNAQIITLDIQGRALNLINHHAHWEVTPEGSDISVEKMQMVADRVRALQGPIIMAGDLNLNPGTPAMKVWDGLLEDLTATHQLQSTLSVLGKVQNVACDHVLVNDQVRVTDYHISDALVSDHNAVIMEFEL